MNRVAVLFATGLAVVCAAAECRAQGWRGIVPLRSTRSDVERRLDPPVSSDPGSAVFSLPDRVVTIEFAHNLDFGVDCERPVAEGTVTSIRVEPSRHSTVRQLKRQVKGLRRFTPKEARGVSVPISCGTI